MFIIRLNVCINFFATNFLHFLLRHIPLLDFLSLFLLLSISSSLLFFCFVISTSSSSRRIKQGEREKKQKTKRRKDEKLDLFSFFFYCCYRCSTSDFSCEERLFMLCTWRMMSRRGWKVQCKLKVENRGNFVWRST